MEHSFWMNRPSSEQRHASLSLTASLSFSLKIKDGAVVNKAYDLHLQLNLARTELLMVSAKPYLL